MGYCLPKALAPSVVAGAGGGGGGETPIKI